MYPLIAQKPSWNWHQSKLLYLNFNISRRSIRNPALSAVVSFAPDVSAGLSFFNSCLRWTLADFRQGPAYIARYDITNATELKSVTLCADAGYSTGSDWGTNDKRRPPWKYSASGDVTPRRNTSPESNWWSAYILRVVSNYMLAKCVHKIYGNILSVH